MRKAFTLVEMLIVVAIIGILISVSIYAWTSAAARSRDSARKTDLARIKQVLQQFYSDTRSYPTFQTTGTVFAASYQLTSNGLANCSHPNNQALTSKYLAEIPTDPKDPTDYATASCSDLSAAQRDRYLYISGPTDASAPTSPARMFGLMATLEKPSSAEILDNSLNPLLASTTQFGPWYDQRNPELVGVNANYLISQLTQ